MSEIEHWLRPFLPKPGRVALDVGANIGSWTDWLAGRFEHVVAVEPNPQVLPRLEEIAAAHGNVTLVEAAAGAKKGRAHLNLFLNPAHATLYGDASLETVPRGDPTGEAVVDVVALDSLRLRKVDFVKIDVEGAERDVVEGAPRLLASRPALLVEVHTVANRDWLTDHLADVYGEPPQHLPHPAPIVPEGHCWLICKGR